MRTIKEIAKDAHDHAVKIGAYGNDPDGAILDKIREETDELELAIISRSTPDLVAFNFSIDTGGCEKRAFEKTIKNTIHDELADIVITALAASVEMGIDISHHIESKMAYNKIR